MAKEKTSFTCTECGGTSPRWMGQCPHCQAWNTLVETVAEVPGTSKNRLSTSSGQYAGLAQAQAVQPLALNRQQQLPSQQRLAINRVQQPSEQAIDQLTEEAMSDWVEVGGEDFMNPIIELAATAASFDEFNAGLLALQESLSAEQFTQQLADYTFRLRGMGDVQDA